jgi:hypothetical protein
MNNICQCGWAQCRVSLSGPQVALVKDALAYFGLECGGFSVYILISLRELSTYVQFHSTYYSFIHISFFTRNWRPVPDLMTYSKHSQRDIPI